MEVKRNGSGGAFHPFKKEKSQVGTSTAATVAPVPVNRSVPPASTSSSAETGDGSGGNKKTDKEREAQRKARRCWSTELHRKFLQALQQLGGSHRMYYNLEIIYNYSYDYGLINFFLTCDIYVVNVGFGLCSCNTKAN